MSDVAGLAEERSLPTDLVARLREFDWYGPPRKGADELFNEAASEIERLRGFLIEIAAPCTMDEKTFFARQALDTKRVTVHGPQCPCGHCEAQRVRHTL